MAITSASSHSPRGSPDKSKVAFKYGSNSIGFLYHDGSNFYQFVVPDSNPSFSSDGKRIVTGSGTLYGSNVDESNSVDIGSGHSPSWSPDGSKIVFYKSGGESDDLWTIQPDGSDEVKLTNFTTCPAGGPAWSPDGSKISYERGVCGIWVMDADGTNQKRIGDSNGSGRTAWSPDGTNIVTTNYGQSNDIWVLDTNIEVGGTCSSWVEQTPPASILASGIGVLSIGTWLDQISKVA